MKGEQITTADSPYEFHEVDGLIVSITPSRVRRERDELLRINPELQPWELEHFLNHEHLDAQNGREGLCARRWMRQSFSRRRSGPRTPTGGS